jgi:aspartyl/asparaginyl beta-hydroxylase (cupin superfamily)
LARARGWAYELRMQAAVDQERLIHEGAQALRHGRTVEARTCFERAASVEGTNPLAWLLLAIACRQARDQAAEEAALDRLLALDPRSLRGLIMKGDCRAHAGAQAEAIGFYRAALGIAETAGIPPDDLDEVQRARVALRELEDRAHAKREALMTRRGLPPVGWSPRFAQALDIAAGRRRLYVQRPTVFTYPELPHVQYYDPTAFPWAAAIEAATAAVREELQALLSADGLAGFRPYIEAKDGAVRLDTNKSLVENKDWSALFLSENGGRDERLVARCPKTWEALQQAPLVDIPGWGPTVMFSLLRAGARIAPHTGMFNTRLVCHLPLIVPSGCFFRVGNEVREWREGKLFIFDDTIEHEAWNESDQDRVVLIFDIWRPELSPQERRELTALFANA